MTEMRVALTVPDFDAALAFYRDALGLAQIADWSSEGGRVVLLDAGRATLELFDEAQAETVDRIEAGRRVSGSVRLALEVTDSDSTARRLVAAGAEEVAPPVTTPWGDRNARVRAPDGMQLTLFTTVRLRGVRPATRGLSRRRRCRPGRQRPCHRCRSSPSGSGPGTAGGTAPRSRTAPQGRSPS